MAKTEKHPGGRPTDYKPEYCEQVEKLCKLGATDEEIAAFFEVHKDTIYEWQKKHPKFSDSVKAGKVIADAEVANSLHKRAVGYKFDEETYEKGVHTKTVTKEVAPDPGAALNWLKNRQPKLWRDKQEIDVRTPEGITVNYNQQKGNDPL